MPLLFDMGISILVPARELRESSTDLRCLLQKGVEDMIQRLS